MTDRRHGAAATPDDRPLSSMSGWQQVTDNFYYMAGVGVRALAVSTPQFELDLPKSHVESETRSAIGSSRPDSSLSSTAATRNPRPRPHLFRLPNLPVATHENVPSTIAEGAPDAKEKKKKEEEEEGHAGESESEPEQPYHVFSRRQKWQLVITAGLVALFAGLSSNIYFPAQDEIAKDLKISLAMVELTITSYLLVQGVTSIFWGAFADAIGRRPVYLISIGLYLVANLALSFSPNFVVLLFFRGVQSGGSASTLILGSGLITDISPTSERGIFISFYLAIRNFSIAVGPVLGGGLADEFGFRSIFVFLLIVTTLLLIIVVFYLPETLRTIAGNGSLRLSGIYQPWIRKFKKPEYALEEPGPRVSKKITSRTILAPLMLMREKDILVNLLFSGLLYAIWGMVTSTTTTMFQSAFHLNETLIGICFLPNGFGTIMGSVLAGTLMTADYKAAKEAYLVAHELPEDHELISKTIPSDFPLERARLRHIPWITGVFVVSLGLYGFAMSTPLVARRGWIAVPLLLQFLIAASSNAVVAINQTVISDLCPGQGASSTAVNNLVSRLLNALGVAFVEQLREALGAPFLFLGLALFGVACTPLAAANWYWSPGWRRARLERLGGSQEEEGAATAKEVVPSASSSTSDLEKNCVPVPPPPTWTRIKDT